MMQMDYRMITQTGLENARFLLKDIGQGKVGETVTLICDDYTHSGANLLAICARKLGLIPIVIDLSVYGIEYLTPVERPYLPHVHGALDRSDMAFSFSPTYAWHLGGQKQFDAVHDGRRRFFTILGNGIDEWNFDHDEILKARRRTPLLRHLVENGKEMRITTAQGTDLTCRIGRQNIDSIYDVLSLVPFYSEVAVVPKIGTVNGTAVIDGASQRGIRSMDYRERRANTPPMILEFKDSELIRYEAPNDEQKKSLEEFINGVSPRANQADEVGLVTVTSDINDKYLWSWWGDGTHHSKSVHIALGNNVSNRASMIHASAHSDFDMYHPMIEIDGHIIYKDDVFDDTYLEEHEQQHMYCAGNKKEVFK